MKRQLVWWLKYKQKKAFAQCHPIWWQRLNSIHIVYHSWIEYIRMSAFKLRANYFSRRYENKNWAKKKFHENRNSKLKERKKVSKSDTNQKKKKKRTLIEIYRLLIGGWLLCFSAIYSVLVFSIQHGTELLPTGKRYWHKMKEPSGGVHVFVCVLQTTQVK